MGARSKPHSAPLGHCTRGRACVVSTAPSSQAVRSWRSLSHRHGVPRPQHLPGRGISPERQAARAQCLSLWPRGHPEACPPWRAARTQVSLCLGGLGMAPWTNTGQDALEPPPPPQAPALEAST